MLANRRAYIRGLGVYNRGGALRWDFTVIGFRV